MKLPGGIRTNSTPGFWGRKEDELLFEEVEFALLEFELAEALLLLNEDLLDIMNHIGVKPTAISIRATAPRTGVKPHRRLRGTLAAAGDEN